jgi:hypothetical protein
MLSRQPDNELTGYQSLNGYHLAMHGNKVIFLMNK